MSGRLSIEEFERRHAPIRTSQLELAGRPFLTLRYETSAGTFLGEAAPLSGFGEDSLERARAALGALSSEQLQRGTDALCMWWNDHGTCAQAGAWEPLRQLSPGSSASARFCFEMVCARAAAHASSTDLFGLLRSEAGLTELKTSQVLDPLSPEFLTHYMEAYDQGIRTFKLKCGRALRAEVAAIERACTSRTFDIKLRLDVNRAYSLQAAGDFIRAVKGLPVEWCEDITNQPERWGALRTWGIPLAVDEHLALAGQEVARHAETLVLKPMALGGFGACYRWAEWGLEHGKSCCVSHLFDGEVSFEATAALAFSIHSVPGAAALSAHAGLGDGATRRFSWLFPDRIIVPFPS